MNDYTFYQNIRNDEENARKNQQAALNKQFELLQDEANKAKQAEADRQGRITAGTNSVNSSFDSMFSPDFYQGRQNDMIGYFKPQLDDKFADAQKQLTYWLSDRGLLKSSVRGDKTAEAQKTYDTGLRDINSRALDFSNTIKGNVGTARSQLISDVRNSNDPSATATQALSSASDLRSSAATPVSSNSAGSLGDIFGAFTGALSTQANLERASALSGNTFKPAFNTGLFAPSNSVKII